jgi:hypothetical protein
VSAFYDNMAATARRLLTQYGQACTLTRTTTGEYDPDTGTAPVTTETQSVKCAVIDYPAALIDGSIIQVGDKKVIMESSATAPQAVDTLTVGATVYQIISVKPLEPAGINVIYTLQVRR